MQIPKQLLHHTPTTFQIKIQTNRPNFTTNSCKHLSLPFHSQNKTNKFVKQKKEQKQQENNK